MFNTQPSEQVIEQMNTLQQTTLNTQQTLPCTPENSTYTVEIDSNGPPWRSSKNSTPQREIDCPLGVASESSFLLCRPSCRTPPAYKCKQMQLPRWRVKKSSLDRVPSDSSSSQSLHQINQHIVRYSFWPEALRLNGSGLATVSQHALCGKQRQIAQRAGCKARFVITHVSLRNENETK